MESHWLVSALILLSASVAPAAEKTSGLKLFEVATGKELVSVSAAEKGASITSAAFSPDGKLLVGQVRAAKDGRNWLKFWNAATAEQLGSIEGDQNDFFDEDD